MVTTANMDESAGALMYGGGSDDDDDALELYTCDDDLDQCTTAFASMDPVLTVEPKAPLKNVHAWIQEAVSTGASDTISRSDEARLVNLNEESRVAYTPHDEHKPSRNGVMERALMPRRGHSKSRRGCYSCKRRRVKCPENHPVCTQCTRRGLTCKWPELYIGHAVEVTKESLPIPRQMELSTHVFTPQDFRLFQHFIQDAHPSKPLGNDSIWTHEIPSISHDYDYLLHAILALAASDLEESASQPSFEVAQSAMYHRVQAIKSFNRALSSGLQSPENGNAMLATCYILLYQSVLMAEGLSEYLTFVRGCVLIPLQMNTRGLKFLFQNLLSIDEIEMARPYLEGMPAIDLGPVDAACASLEALAPLCERDADKMICEQMLALARSFYISSCDGYMAWLKGSVIFSCSVSHAEFLTLIEPSNHIGKLIQSHVVAIQTLIAPIIEDERSARKASQFVKGMVKWLEILHSNIDPTMRSYYEWPITRAAQLRLWFGF